MSSGKLVYERQAHPKVYVEVCPDIANYYRSVIPKAGRVQGTRYKPHITVLRTGIETVVNKQKWGYREGELINFIYSNRIRNHEVYWWIDAWSEEIKNIREELGLPPTRKGYRKFHITIGNSK